MNPTIKTSILSFFLVFSLASDIQAQVDIKFNPLGIVFFGPVNVSAEFSLSDKIALDLGAGLRLNSSLIPYRNNTFKEDYKIFSLLQYYPNAFDSMDRFSIGIYSKNRFGKFSVGDIQLPFRRMAFGFAIGLKYYNVPTRFGFGVQLGAGIAYINNFTNVDGARNDFKGISAESGLVDGLANFTVSYRLNPVTKYYAASVEDPLNFEPEESPEVDRRKKTTSSDRKKTSRKKTSKKSRKKSKGKKKRN